MFNFILISCLPKCIPTSNEWVLLCTQSCPTVCDPLDCSPPGSSMRFSRQEYWRGLPFPPPGDLPDPGIEPKSAVSLALQENSLLLSHQGSPLAAPHFCLNLHFRNDMWCGASFHMFICHLYIFFGAVSDKVFHPFSTRLFVFFLGLVAGGPE